MTLSAAGACTTVPVIDPATGAVWEETPLTPPAEVQSIVERARRAQPTWASRPYAERQAAISRFSRLFFARRQEIAALVSRENGKPLAEALLIDVAVTLDLVKYYLHHAGRFLAPRPVRHANVALFGKSGKIYLEPLGVIGVIAPWNYPLLLPMGDIVPALLAGNAVVFKPSEFTSRIAVQVVDLLHQAGVPEDCCRVVAGYAETGVALVDAGPDKIFFTGSVATGRKVAVQAAERLIPVNLELGGSDPCIVLADADLDRALSGVIWGRFTNGGQTCVAVKRLIVEAPVYAGFLERLVERVRALRMGPGLMPEVDMGPMIRPSQLAHLEDQLSRALAHGARVLTGGRRRPDLGPTFFEPTVVTDVGPDSPLWREEVFGPILPVVRATDAEDAVRLANNSDFGLAASVWTRDLAQGRDLARRIEAGAVMVNDAASYVGAVGAPHGGVKLSGLGRTHGEFGITEVTRPKYVDIDRLTWLHKPWWFGYTRESLAGRDAFLRFKFGGTLLERLGGIAGTVRLLFNRRKI